MCDTNKPRNCSPIISLVKYQVIEKAISNLVENLNSGCSYLITAVKKLRKVVVQVICYLIDTEY